MINQQNYSFHWLFISKNWSIFNLSNVEALMLSRLELKEKQERSWKKKKNTQNPATILFLKHVLVTMNTDFSIGWQLLKCFYIKNALYGIMKSFTILCLMYKNVLFSLYEIQKFNILKSNIMLRLKIIQNLSPRQKTQKCGSW